MISVGGTPITTPSEFQADVMDISKAERNAEGTLIIERIATKRKLKMQWNVLTNSEISTLLSAIASSTFTVEYPDPVTGAARSGTFYVGDRSAPMIDYISSTPRWKDISFNFIEV